MGLTPKDQRWCRNAPGTTCSEHADCPACPAGTPACGRLCEARQLKFYVNPGGGHPAMTDLFLDPDERGLHKDYAKWLEGLAPFDASPERYAHNRTGEDNADAHMKRQIMGREVVVAITKGQLDFGPWEQIFYGEFDGKRNKRVLIKVIGD